MNATKELLPYKPLSANQEVDAILHFNNFFQTLHESVQMELIKLSLVLFRDAKSCTIDIQLPELVRITLKPYPGIKGWYNRYIKRYDKKHKENAKFLVKSVYFWVPFSITGSKPKIEVIFDQ